jgi:hypothetical protein
MSASTPSAAAAPAQIGFDDVAKVCNEANRALCEVTGDISNPPWDHVEPWRHDFVVDGVKLALTSGTPSQIHDLWRQRKISQGWTYGSENDPKAKVSPNIVPYAELPEIQKKKNALFVSTATTVGCGVERWNVKTLADPSAAQVSLTPTATGSIAELVALHPPTMPTTRVHPVEFETYQLEGNLTLAKRESDSDIHMVLNDDHGNHMIIEATCPTCAQDSVVAAQIAAVRSAVEKQFPTAAAGGRELLEPAVAVVVSGVAFFDRLHGQEGVAPNGIELHPLLSFRLTS